MLIVSRRKNEQIVIGDIVLTVVEVRGDKVRLRVEPPVATPRVAEEAPFIRAILENRRDPSYRLIFADCLEERGDPLGELLRIDCELEDSSLTADRRSALEVRQRELWSEFGNSWLGLKGILRTPGPRSSFRLILQ
jgi:carbon storage regulator